MTRLAALLAIAALIAAVSGCGSNDVNGTLTADQALQLNADLDAVARATGGGQCASAEAKVSDYVDHVNALPATAGTDFKSTLRDAGTSLQQQVQEQCAAAGATGLTGRQPTNSDGSSSKETTSTSTDTTTTQSTTTTAQEEPQNPPVSGNGTTNGGGGGNANGQGNANPGVGTPGGGNPGGGSTGGTGGTGGTGIGGD
jgi:hypothetical protein